MSEGVVWHTHLFIACMVTLVGLSSPFLSVPSHPPSGLALPGALGHMSPRRCGSLLMGGGRGDGRGEEVDSGDRREVGGGDDDWQRK